MIHWYIHHTLKNLQVYNTIYNTVYSTVYTYVDIIYQ